MTDISFVYFDVGGVVIKDFSDTNKWRTMLSDLGIREEDTDSFNKLFKDYEDDICTGKMSVDEFANICIVKLGLSLPQNFSLLNYFVDNFEANLTIRPVIDSLKSKVRVGLLTDQYPDMYSSIVKKGILPNVTWDVIVDSSVEGLRKPDPAIYKRASEKANVKGENILFIDNREKNLVPARNLGWQTYLYDSKDYENSTRNLTNYLKDLSFIVI